MLKCHYDDCKYQCHVQTTLDNHIWVHTGDSSSSHQRAFLVCDRKIQAGKIRNTKTSKVDT